MQNKNISFRSCSLLFFSVLILLSIFFEGVKIVYADTPIELNVEINSGGYVSWDTCVGSIVRGTKTFRGFYPDETTLIGNGAYDQVCSLIKDGYHTMEGGYANGGFITENDDYWVKATYEGTLGTPDYSGTWYHWSATKSGGYWFSTSSPRIISIDPFKGKTENTNSVELEVEIFNDSAEEVCWKIQNFDLQLQLLPICIPLTFSGEGTVSTTTTLMSGYYFGTVEAQGGSTQIISEIASFVVVETQTGGLSLLPISTTTESNAFISAIQRLFVSEDTGLILQQRITNLQDLLKTKLPFAYVYDVNAMRQAMLSAASSTSQTVSVNIKIIPGQGTSTITFISKEMLEAISISPLVKNILTWLLWLLAVEYIYYRVIRSHDQNTPS